MRVLAVLLVLLFSGSALAAAPEDSPSSGVNALGAGVIIPGRQIRSLRLDMPLAQILEAAGPQPCRRLPGRQRGAGSSARCDADTPPLRIQR